MKRQDRIALVAEGLPFGGTTTFCVFLAAELRRLGVETWVFNFGGDSPLQDEFDAHDVPVYHAAEDADIYEDRLHGVYRKLVEFQPTAVYAILAQSSFEILRYLPDDVLRVGMLHDPLEYTYQLAECYQDSCDWFFTGNSTVCETMKSRFPSARTERILYGVPMPEDRPIRCPHDEDPIRLLYFGRLEEPHKQPRIFPLIWRELKRRRIDFRWTIHGRGPEEDYLKREMSEGVTSGEIVFSDSVPREQLRQLVAEHDVFLLTSVFEGGPQTLIEAMSQGLVPVCGDIPCLVSDVVTPDTGRRVPVREAAAYVDAIQELASDRTELNRLSKNSRESVESVFSTPAMARRHLEFLKKAQPEIRPAKWPDTIHPRPIKGANSLKFSPLLRPLRRLLKRGQNN